MKRNYLPLILFVLSMLLVVVFGCKKEEVQEVKLVQHFDVVTFPVSDVEFQSATCGGLVSGGTGPITSGICWDTIPTPTVSKNLTVDNDETGSYTSKINDLEPGVTYYVRAYVTQDTSTTYGNTMSFKTKRASFHVMTTSLNVSTNSASIGVTVSADQGVSVLNKGICWSLLPYPTIEDSVKITMAIFSPFSTEIINLAPNTLYYVRAYASSNNEVIYGENVAIRTRQKPLSVMTNRITEITYTTALCGGSSVISDQPSSITARGVCWSKSSCPTIADTKTMNGFGIDDYTSTLTGLSAGTTYYVRAYVTDAETTVYGKSYSFKTTEDVIPDGVPTVVTLSVAKLNETTANLQGTISDTGKSPMILYGLYYSLSPYPTESNKISSTSSSIKPIPTSFTLPIYQLKSGTKYYIRAYAKNSHGIGYGNVIEYTH